MSIRSRSCNLPIVAAARRAALAAIVLAMVLPTTMTAQSIPIEDIKLEFEVVASGFDRPIWVTHAADGSGDLYVFEKTGQIRILHADGVVRETPFLDVTDRVASDGNEQGLLGLAFHPDYASNGRFFIHHTRTPDNRVVISEFTAVGGTADLASERIILEVDQPGLIHNGATVLFDADGYLLISLGDGGRGGETVGRDGDPDSLLGKILRIDIDGGDPYAIPAGNGFEGVPDVRPEVHLKGFRNPYRFSLDPIDGHIIIGDVSHIGWEEINVAKAGETELDFGWNTLEGPQCGQRNELCDPGAYEAPTLAYAHHGGGAAIVGGVIYAGTEEPELEGLYLFGDWALSEVRAVSRADLLAGGATSETIGVVAGRGTVTAFGQNEQGEIFIPDGRDSVLRVRASGPG